MLQHFTYEELRTKKEEVDTTSKQFSFLLMYLLEVNKSRLVCVQHEPLAVGTDRILADGRLGVLKLLLYILDDRLAVQTHECATDQLWVHRMGAHYLPADAQQGANPGSGELSDPEEQQGR